MNKTAVVTGAARGIGKAIAIKLAEKRIQTIAVDIDGRAAAETARHIRDLGFTADSFQLDVSEVAQIGEKFAGIAEMYGAIDILINNAGILSTTTLAELTESEWDRTMSINLKGAVFATQAALPYMIRGGWGRIVNISSMAGQMGGFSTGCAYTASKSALIGITMRIAREVAGNGITVNAVAPGTANTEMVLGFTKEAQEALKRSIPVGKLVEPGDIGETVAFLVSDAAGSITGAVIDINGGMFMG